MNLLVTEMRARRFQARGDFVNEDLLDEGCQCHHWQVVYFFLEQQLTKTNSACLGGCGVKSMEVTEQVARLPARKSQEISFKFDLTTDPSL